jgi:hypothetical protein
VAFGEYVKRFARNKFLGTCRLNSMLRERCPSAELFLRCGRIGLPGMLRARRINMSPRAHTPHPDVCGNLHVAWVIKRSDPEYSSFRARGTLTVDGRSAVTAEVTVEHATAVGCDGVALRRTLGDVQRRSGNHGIDTAARPGSLLAVLAMAGAKLRDRNAHSVAYCAAKAAAGERLCRGKSSSRSIVFVYDTAIDPIAQSMTSF